MEPTSADRAHAEPLHFRIRGVLPPSDQSRGEIDLLIDCMTMPPLRYSAKRVTLMPYMAALERAIVTGAVYWVDLSDIDILTFSPRMNDTILIRILKALENRQLVVLEAGNGEIQPE